MQVPAREQEVCFTDFQIFGVDPYERKTGGTVKIGFGAAYFQSRGHFKQFHFGGFNDDYGIVREPALFKKFGEGKNRQFHIVRRVHKNKVKLSGGGRGGGTSFCI